MTHTFLSAGPQSPTGSSAPTVDINVPTACPRRMSACLRRAYVDIGMGSACLRWVPALSSLPLTGLDCPGARGSGLLRKTTSCRRASRVDISVSLIAGHLLSTCLSEQAATFGGRVERARDWRVAEDTCRARVPRGVAGRDFQPVAYTYRPGCMRGADGPPGRAQEVPTGAVSLGGCRTSPVVSRSTPSCHQTTSPIPNRRTTPISSLRMSHGRRR